MSPEIEARVRRALTDGGAELCPADDLARAVIRRGRRVRRVRRVSLGITVVSSVAAILAVPNLLAGAGHGQNPTDNPTATNSVDASPTLDPEAVPIDADRPGASPAEAEAAAWAAGLPSGPAPSLPYTLAGWLHDGPRKIRLPGPGPARVSGRVADGWLVLQYSSADKQISGPDDTARYGILTTSGSFDVLAVGNPRGVAISPDRQRVVYAVQSHDLRTRVTVVELSTAQHTDSLRLSAHDDVKVLGWNPAGIWLSNSIAPGRKPQLANGLSRWKPGSKPVLMSSTIPWARVQSNTDRLLTVGDPVGSCHQVLRPVGRQLRKLASYCELASGTAGSLSPDGTTLVLPTGSVYQVPGKRIGGMGLHAGVGLGGHIAGWETPSEVLLTFGPVSDTLWVLRCTLAGTCERAAMVRDPHVVTWSLAQA